MATMARCHDLPRIKTFPSNNYVRTQWDRSNFEGKVEGDARLCVRPPKWVAELARRGRDIQRPMDDEAFMSDIEYLSLQASIICLLLFILSTGHCPSDSAMSIAASRISSASTRSSIERANTIPPTHSVAIARARDRAACPLRRNACAKTSIITLSTASNACRTRCSSRKKSVGKAIRGQVPSISSKCSRETSVLNKRVLETIVS